MQLNLTKGSKFNLQKSIQKIAIQTGWDIAAKPGENFDVDLWCVGLTQTPSGPKLFNDGSHVVIYCNPGLKKLPNKSFQTTDGSITHTGDNRTGAGKTDVDEQIDVNLSALPDAIDEIGIFISIYDAEKRKQTFGQVTSTFVRIFNNETQESLCQYDMTREFVNDQIVQVGSLVKDNGAWTFKAVGAGGGPGADANTVLGQF